VAGANTNFESLSRLHGGDAALSQQAPVEEGVAGPIGEFNEAKALFGIKPFDDTMNGWAGGCLEPGLAEPGSGSESAIVGRYQRRSRDAANDENLDLSTLVPGGA
jgi:hypothetical protein